MGCSSGIISSLGGGMKDVGEDVDWADPVGTPLVKSAFGTENGPLESAYLQSNRDVSSPWGKAILPVALSLAGSAGGPAGTAGGAMAGRDISGYWANEPEGARTTGVLETGALAGAGAGVNAWANSAAPAGGAGGGVSGAGVGEGGTDWSALAGLRAEGEGNWATDAGGVATETPNSGVPYTGQMSGWQGGETAPLDVSSGAYANNVAKVTPKSSFWGDLPQYSKGAMPYMAGAGLISNIIGQYMSSEQQKKNLEAYTQANTWNSDKASTYLNASSANLAGTLGGAAAKSKGTLAEQMASAGRGGGGYGTRAMAIDEDVLSQLAGGKNQALTTVSQPPNLSPAPFMSQTSPTAGTFSGLGGTAGNLMSQMATMELMRKMRFFRDSDTGEV